MSARSTACGRTTRGFPSGRCSSSTARESSGTSTCTTSASSPTASRSSMYCASWDGFGSGARGVVPGPAGLVAGGRESHWGEWGGGDWRGEMSRRCVPYAPFDRDLAEATIGIVGTTGIYAKSEAAFPTEDPGSIEFRSVGADAPLADLAIAHHHYDHSEADRDPNIVFPLETLRELARDGVIAAPAAKHFSLGFTTRLRELYEQTFPQLVREVERSRADAVLVVAGCANVCHRSAANLQREIEMRGIAAVFITVSPDVTETMRVSRALHPHGFPLGPLVGPAGRRDVHRAVVGAALELLSADRRPGATTHRDFPL